jgi:hypothetical protein
VRERHIDSEIQDQPVIGEASSLLFAKSDGGVNRLLYMRLDDGSLHPSKYLEQVFLWVGMYSWMLFLSMRVELE